MDKDELDALLEAAAERGAEKAMEKLIKHGYEEVGRKVVTKLFQVFGAITIGAIFWAIQQGWFK